MARVAASMLQGPVGWLALVLVLVADEGGFACFDLARQGICRLASRVQSRVVGVLGWRYCKLGLVLK